MEIYALVCIICTQLDKSIGPRRTPLPLSRFTEPQMEDVSVKWQLKCTESNKKYTRRRPSIKSFIQAQLRILCSANSHQRSEMKKH